MIETFKQVFVLFVSFLLIINGIIVIKKGHFEIGIGGGRAPARPIISIPINGIGATTFGISSIISGLIILSYVVVMYARQETSWLDNAFSIGTVVIIGLLALGLVVGFALQVLMRLIEVFSKKDDTPTE